MSVQLTVRLTGIDGNPLPAFLLETLYASGMEFEPDVRQSRIMPDGSVELKVETQPYMLHARVELPLYGNIWVMAHNRGEGYRGDAPIDFISEAIESYIWEAETRSEGGPRSPFAAGHLEAAREYYRLARQYVEPGYSRLTALSHAVLAAEAACFESARETLASSPRPELLLGCNAFGYRGDDRFAEYFPRVFNLATIPFYYRELAPEEGRFEFSRRDELVQWCESLGITPKGHPLWFGHKETNPDWMFAKSYKELSHFARYAVSESVKRYRGRIKIWDAMNEPHDWANCFSFTQEELFELTRICCDTVREHDPDAVSLINVCLPFAEYVAGKFVCYGPVFERPVSPMAFFRNAIDAGIDFDALGIQLYFPARDMAAVSRLLDVYAGFGKPVQITEMGVPGGNARGRTDTYEGIDPASQIGLTKGGWHAPWNEHVQADWMEWFYTIAAARPEIEALSWWDFTDPGFMKNSPFLFEDRLPREIYFRLLALKPFLTGSR